MVRGGTRRSRRQARGSRGRATASACPTTHSSWLSGPESIVALPAATTWTPERDPEVFGGLLRDLEEGYTKRVAFIVPPGNTWPLPAYELALMTAWDAPEA